MLTEQVDWPETEGRPRRAGVSAFGISGTNAHVILERDATESEFHAAGDGSDDAGVGERAALIPWVLSGRDGQNLRAQAGRFGAFAARSGGLDPVDVGFSLATSRASLERRAVVFGRDESQLLAGIGSLARGESAPNVVDGTLIEGGKRAFLFSGQGSQRLGMGRELAGVFPVFAAALDAVC
ncbi:hypothetical protein ADK64_08020, partial [Streptomyces sp. MMG1121]